MISNIYIKKITKLNYEIKCGALLHAILYNCVVFFYLLYYIVLNIIIHLRSIYLFIINFLL